MLQKMNQRGNAYTATLDLSTLSKMCIATFNLKQHVDEILNIVKLAVATHLKKEIQVID